MNAAPRRDAPRRSVFAESDHLDREQTILYALQYGVPCERQSLRNQREHDFCAAMRRPIADLRARGIAIYSAAVPR